VPDSIARLYEEHARDYDRDRGRSLQERAWLDRFADLIPAGGAILDVGCGMGEPLAGYLIGRGLHVIGVDTSPTLIEMCRARFPAAEWIVADMRHLALGRAFDGILVWDSLFHLPMGDQRAMFDVLAAHARPGAVLLFTSGPDEGESVGTYCGKPLYHASLSPDEYRALLAGHGFDVLMHVVNDDECGNHTVWLARRALV
jgi:SAM-dependent methyltransferase